MGLKGDAKSMASFFVALSNAQGTIMASLDISLASSALSTLMLEPSILSSSSA
jgi:hypothetical protein